jgi:hypothetical protein
MIDVYDSGVSKYDGYVVCSVTSGWPGDGACLINKFKKPLIIRSSKTDDEWCVARNMLNNEETLE